MKTILTAFGGFMKKLFILLGLEILFILSVSAQTGDEKSLHDKVEEHGFITSAATAKDDDTIMQQTLNDVLTYDVDISGMLSPILLKAFSHYSIRKVVYGEREIIFNAKLATLLEGLENNVEQLENTEDYVKELRVIVYDAENIYILAKAMSLYGRILDVNPPKVSDEEAYSPHRLYILDSLNVLKRSSALANNNVQSTQIVMHVIPYLRKAVQKDPSITRDEFF